MAKQILVGIEEQNLNEVAHYLVIYFPYNEEMCSYTDDWLGELYENKYPLVSKGMWSGIIDLKFINFLIGNQNMELYIFKLRYVIAEPISCLIKIKR